MTLTELKYLVALDSERHFGRAADRSFVSQPTLSVALRKLEDELGVTLFERHRGEARPTPIGERIIAQARVVLSEAAQIEQLVNGIRDNLIAGNTNWVTVFYQNAAGSPPSLADIQQWEQQYHQSNVWVMAETSGVSAQWLPTQGIPFFVSVGADFNYLNVNNGYEWSDLATP